MFAEQQIVLRRSVPVILACGHAFLAVVPWLVWTSSVLMDPELSSAAGATPNRQVIEAVDAADAKNFFASVVLYVKDETWGGRIEGMERLSPTSQAMVDCSDVLVGIGGGAVSCDELLAAKQQGKPIKYIAAEMSHKVAIEKARRSDQEPPTDFRGAAHATFGEEC